MLKLDFKLSLDTPFENTLAISRYQRFWDQNQAQIVDSFTKHTGLKFRQRKITVRAIDEHTSRAGNSSKPMELNRYLSGEAIGPNLIHELAHRLVIGNGIVTSDNNPAWTYHSHRHIDLFLYDVWVDVVGKAAADKALSDERSNGYDYYKKAWDWALNKSYADRQKTINKLKSRSQNLAK